jgi:Phage terminase large subunit (GpA)/Phage portal protein, lambda family
MEENVCLPAGVTAEAGLIKLYPYQRGIAQAIADPKIERVTVLKSARVGYSTIMIASIAHFIVREPSPILVLMPTEADCRDLMVSDIEPLFEDSFEPGIMRVLPPGSDVVFPDVPTIEGSADFLRHMLRTIAAGVGLPYELLAGDLSQVNYSSAKTGFSQFYRRAKAIRALITARLLDPVWARVVTLEILSGRLAAPDFAINAEDYFAATFLFPQPTSLWIPRSRRSLR